MKNNISETSVGKPVFDFHPVIYKIDAKKRLNTLNIIKNSEIKHKRLIPGQKELLNLFNDLSDIILTDKTLMSSKEENEKLKEEKENENENVNENDETLK